MWEKCETKKNDLRIIKKIKKVFIHMKESLNPELKLKLVN